MTETSWIKKKDNKKFYGYTGPVKPEKSSWIKKKSDKENTSYGYTKVVKQKKEPTTWIKKKKKKIMEPLPTIDSKWLKKKKK